MKKAPKELIPADINERDSIHERDGKWYFWDETWGNEVGPFETEAEARVELDKYVSWLG